MCMDLLHTRDQGNTYMIISKVAYLSGVDRRIFENIYEPPKMEYFQQLEQNREARIIRNLCRLRTAIEQNFSSICTAMQYDLKNLHTLPQYIPVDCITALEKDGLSLIKANHKLNQYIIDINRHIANHISKCRPLFPLWLNWDYIRALFIMPDGYSLQGIKRAAAKYYSHKCQYPYQIYLNWSAGENGNIFYNDKKFVTLLYESHGDRFQNFGLVSDAGQNTKNGIYDFVAQHNKIIIAVDCENADPYKFHNMLSSLQQKNALSHVEKIILYNDTHTNEVWKLLNRFTDLPVEHHMTERIKAEKSLVDFELIIGVCREYYEHQVDSVILVSSDSDYWSLISKMHQLDFLVMVEEAKCGRAIRDALDEAGVMYCYMDDFCTNAASKMMITALLDELQRTLTASLSINLQTILQQAYHSVRANMSEIEKTQFYDRYVKPLKIGFDQNGEAIILLQQ